MKRNLVVIALAGGLFLLFQSFEKKGPFIAPIPDEVIQVLESSCYACHSTDARNQDAREALDFEKWDTYRLTKKIGLLGKICEFVEGEKMPPARFLESNPDRKLTASQKQLICDWTKEESASLMETD